MFWVTKKKTDSGGEKRSGSLNYNDFGLRYFLHF